MESQMESQIASQFSCGKYNVDKIIYKYYMMRWDIQRDLFHKEFTNFA